MQLDLKLICFYTLFVSMFLFKISYLGYFLLLNCTYLLINVQVNKVPFLIDPDFGPDGISRFNPY